MNNLIINIPLHSKNTGTTGNLSINLKAKNIAKFYQPYPYFFLNIIHDKSNVINHGYEIETAKEWIARSRRTVLFSDTLNLMPVRHTLKGFRTIFNKVGKITYCDHMSCWISTTGTKFVMIEPYEDLVINGCIQMLDKVGLSAIEVPIEFSPYCGRWSSLPGALPWSKCYLICDSKNIDELKVLKEILLLENAPAWNTI